MYSDNERGIAALGPELASSGVQLIHSIADKIIQ